MGCGALLILIWTAYSWWCISKGLPKSQDKFLIRVFGLVTEMLRPTPKQRIDLLN